ncbi:MAG: OmpA family protein [Bacteroidia bacterium]|nr:MAG: OmpA family protein [Bacteroidia bacterium]
MKLNRLFLSVLGVALVTNTFAYKGYLNSYVGIVKDGSGSCVHTFYFNRTSDGLASCGEGNESSAMMTKVTYETISVSDADNVLFNFNEASLNWQGKKYLANFATRVDHQQDVSKISIGGYTDAIGSADYNMRLSKRRANAVRNFLITQNYPADKIDAMGYGSSSAIISRDCFAKYGRDHKRRIDEILNKLKARKFNTKHLSNKTLQEKMTLQRKVKLLQVARSKLIACAAPDRRVVFTIMHVEQVEKGAFENSKSQP